MIARSICPSMTFKQEGVVVRHNDRNQVVRVRRLPFPANLSMRGNSLFTPFRLVINLKVDDPAQPGPEIHLDTPMEVSVEYTQADVFQAGGLENLKLGYWNGNAWIAYGVANNFHTVPFDPPHSGGVGIVLVSDWDDPTKAWGT